MDSAAATRLAGAPDAPKAAGILLVHPAGLAYADTLAERGQVEAALGRWAALRDDPAAPSAA